MCCWGVVREAGSAVHVFDYVLAQRCGFASKVQGVVAHASAVGGNDKCSIGLGDSDSESLLWLLSLHGNYRQETKCVEIDRTIER